jgi:hypothetical protein
MLRIMELDRGREGFLDEDPDDGSVEVRGRGCCRILRRPELPNPCSCSVMTGDLGV